MASRVSAVFLPHSMKVHMHKHWVSRVLISRSITRLRTESSGGKNFPMHSCLCVHVRNEGVTCVQHVPARLRPEFPGGFPIRIIYGFTCGIKVSRVYPSHGFAWLRRMYAGGISFCTHKMDHVRNVSVTYAPCTRLRTASPNGHGRMSRIVPFY